MRHALILVGIVLIVSVSAAAQGPAGVGAGASREVRERTRPSGAGRSGFHPSSATNLGHWEFAVGYQYYRINLTGAPFDTNGLNASAVGFLDRWFGLEAQVGAGFGNTGTTTVPANLTAKSLLAGGGPRLAYRSQGPIEPWIHGVAGIERFRFAQTAGVLGDNSAPAVAAGGGIDFRLSGHLALRTEGDSVFTRFFSMNQRHFQAVAGLAFKF